MLIAFVILCVFSSVFRLVLLPSIRFLFLDWNLFLAAVPYCASLLLEKHKKIYDIKMLRILLIAVWVLFFPNAPYLVTDFVYLKHHSETLFWYDACMLFLFALTGLLIGFKSLDMMKKIVLSKCKKASAAVITSVFLFVAAFGVYLGRDLRWNSWDILYEPVEFMMDVIAHFIRPVEHKGTWVFTAGFGIFLNVLYYSVLIPKKWNRL